MFWNFLIFIVIVLIIKYLIDRNKAQSHVRDQGGLLKMYTPFINKVKSDFQNVKILRIDTTSLVIGLRIGDENWNFTIMQSFAEKEGVIYEWTTSHPHYYTKGKILIYGIKDAQSHVYENLINEIKQKRLV